MIQSFKTFISLYSRRCSARLMTFTSSLNSFLVLSLETVISTSLSFLDTDMTVRYLPLKVANSYLCKGSCISIHFQLCITFTLQSSAVIATKQGSMCVFMILVSSSCKVRLWRGWISFRRKEEKKERKSTHPLSINTFNNRYNTLNECNNIRKMLKTNCTGSNCNMHCTRQRLAERICEEF